MTFVGRIDGLSWQSRRPPTRLCETHLLPVIEQMIAQFPFTILGFHADNGCEYVNHRVAQMLNKLRIEFTRSRPRHSNDNGLAETKTGPSCVIYSATATNRSVTPPHSMPSASSFSTPS